MTIFQQALQAGAAAALLVGVSTGVQVQAAPVSITTPFMNLESLNFNSLGITRGTYLRVGANAVTPNGRDGTTGVASTTNTITNQAVSRNIRFDPGPTIPNFFAYYTSDYAGLLGPWNLKFSNGADSSQATVSLPAGTAPAPFVSSITLSGTAASPTFSWAPPPDAVVNGYRINIFDKSVRGPGNNGQVVSVGLQPNQTSYTVKADDFQVRGNEFKLNRNYSIEISLIQTKDGTSNNLGNANLKAIARSYADFTPKEGGGPVVNLPVVLENGSFKFDMAVVAGQTYFIDPEVAVGYDYKVGAGDPNFRSVLLPTGIGDGLYDVWGLDANGQQTVLLADDLAGGVNFDFGLLGVSAFRVLGIEVAAGLDPANTTAFITGLSFVSSGRFSGTQTPITVNTDVVPEPSSLALVALALWAARRTGGRASRVQRFRSS
jgi:hypothetical protein